MKAPPFYQLLLVALLDPCQASGLPKERAEAIYEDLSRYWERIRPEATDEVLIPNLERLINLHKQGR